MADIKNLLNDIIHDTDNNDYPDKNTINMDNKNNTFNKVEFREKLSLNVLKDIISAMMHDETKDLDGMIDASIMRHINTNYGGSCYNYLTKSCDALGGSPLLGSIIQEINNKTEEVAEQVASTKNCQCAMEADLKTKELLESCDEHETYEQFRSRLRDKVSRDIVNEVADTVTDSNAVEFDDIDTKIKQSNEKKDSEIKDEGNTPPEPQTESKIINMCGNIVQEAALNNKPMSVEDGLNKAIVEYCIVQMDSLFKQYCNIDGYSRYLKY